MPLWKFQILSRQRESISEGTKQGKKTSPNSIQPMSDENIDGLSRTEGFCNFDVADVDSRSETESCTT
jgi:hypothetical protein